MLSFDLYWINFARFKFCHIASFHQLLLIIIIIAICLWVEHGPRTGPYCFSLEAAAVGASLRVLLISFLGSFWSSLFQVDFGLPTLRLPWGFHFGDWLVMSSSPFLEVCPGHLHFLCFIVSLVSSWKFHLLRSNVIKHKTIL